jgi:5-methylthioadenosine/S-adenosylhomocysteine deaminase
MSVTRLWFPLTAANIPSRAAAVAAAKMKRPIDPLSGPKLALAGRVVTMDDAFSTKSDAVVYIDKGNIVVIQDRAEPAPPDFAGVPIVETEGTIFPGLIELHNHLSYNALPGWSPVPKRFDNRGQWPNHTEYRPLVSGPMTVLGQYKDVQDKYPLLAPLVRYVECKCLFGGVTTSQGIKLSSNAGIQRFYRGIVRNVEQTDDLDLPEAQARIPDFAARDAANFLARLKAEDSCFLLHLSEGVTDPAKPLSEARKHFLALEIAKDKWALDKTFTGIHAAGLLPADFDVLATHESSIVWSPLSNLLLYGGTARVDAAKNAGVLIGLGSDWSPTGSKNLLGELKVAWLYNRKNLNGLFKAREIVAMATRDAARILKWDKVLGSIKAGARADLLVIDSMATDPYKALLKARETDIRLVMINGIARYGWPDIMTKLAPNNQTAKVSGQTRRLFLEQETADPDVDQISLSKATDDLRIALNDIAKLAKELEKSQRAVPARRVLDAAATPVWSLALDEISSSGVELAPRLPYDGPNDFTGSTRAPRVLAKSAPPLSTILKPIKLDPLTVADDANFLSQIRLQPNVPKPIRDGLSALY